MHNKEKLHTICVSIKVMIEREYEKQCEDEQSKAGSLFMQTGRWCSIIGASWPLGRKRKDRLITPSCECFIKGFCIVRG